MLFSRPHFRGRAFKKEIGPMSVLAREKRTVFIADTGRAGSVETVEGKRYTGDLFWKSLLCVQECVPHKIQGFDSPSKPEKT